MRLDSFLDSFYVLGSLWGVTDPQVCASNAFLSRGAFETTWSSVPSAHADVMAFVDINVVPMDIERVLANQTVLVRNGGIMMLGPASKVPVPTGATRIDGRGKYLIPGLANMHWHEFVGQPISVRDEKQRRAMQDHLFETLARGVTTLRSLEDPGTDQLPMFRRLSREVPSPRLYFVRQITQHTKADSVAAYIAAAATAGYDHIGMPYTMSARTREERAVFDSLVSAARQVRLPISAHAHALPLEAVLTLGKTGGSIEHPFVFWDSLLGIQGPLSTMGLADRNKPTDLPLSKIPALAAAIERAGIWMTPTLRCIDGVHSYIKNLPQLIKALHDAGVKMLLGEDDGFDVHEEMAALVHAGLSPYQALLTGTRNVAQYFRLLDSSGTIAVGKRADLVLLSGNPLVDVVHAREPAGVMIGGRWLDRAALDQGLLASPKYWIRSLLRNHGQEVLPNFLPDDLKSSYGLGRKVGKQHREKLMVLMDSLELMKPQERTEHERVLRLFAEELGALRAILPSEQQRALLDPPARVWMREQARQGSRVVIPGVASSP